MKRNLRYRCAVLSYRPRPFGLLVSVLDSGLRGLVRKQWSNCGVYVNVIEARWCVFRLSKYTSIIASKSQCLKIEKKKRKKSVGNPWLNKLCERKLFVPTFFFFPSIFFFTDFAWQRLFLMFFLKALHRKLAQSLTKLIPSVC